MRACSRRAAAVLRGGVHDVSQPARPDGPIGAPSVDVHLNEPRTPKQGPSGRQGVGSPAGEPGGCGVTEAPDFGAGDGAAAGSVVGGRVQSGRADDHGGRRAPRGDRRSGAGVRACWTWRAAAGTPRSWRRGGSPRWSGLDFAPNLLQTGRRTGGGGGHRHHLRRGRRPGAAVRGRVVRHRSLGLRRPYSHPTRNGPPPSSSASASPGGTIALANWVPGSGGGGDVRGHVAPYSPPPPGLAPPWRWGTAEGAAELLGGGADVTVTPRSFLQRFPSPEAMIATFRESFGPASLTFEAAGPEREAELTAPSSAWCGASTARRTAPAPCRGTTPRWSPSGR